MPMVCDPIFTKVYKSLYVEQHGRIEHQLQRFHLFDCSGTSSI